MMRVKRRYHLRKSAAKELESKLVSRFGESAKKLLQDPIEIMELKAGREIILARGEPVAFKTSEGLFPSLNSLAILPLKRVTVDMGAVGPISSGANTMAPGVIKADKDIARGDIVVVTNERHDKPLAIGVALVNSGSLKGSKGEVVRNFHHIGDEIWDLTKRGVGKD
ncbi:MAG: PUA domain-containing protein [Candidatus Hadarchaeota archaeon]|nr:PUA domain-containing protein [Candidatus Hadarchaeota archaeon]